MSIIDCKHLSISYEGRTIVRDVSFSISAGDYLCIVGENGSGKTTLMRTLLGLKKPDSGQVLFGDGCNVGGTADASCKQNHKIGYLPQKSNLQKDFPASVMEIVLSGTLNESGLFYTRKQKKKAVSAMESLGILNLKKQSFMELSGGQQQRVLLARALCATEDILFLDEPVAGLDPKVTLEMYEMIRTLNEIGITIVMISHDIEAALEYSNHILHLNKDVDFFGTTEEYKKTELCEHYLCHIPDHLHHDDDCEICNEHQHLHEHTKDHLHDHDCEICDEGGER
ncbi:MAG: metal ABC transporter ATP-binding protein [Lachnospiraceae bacterium]|nr:metal ABC transporter ATP-binding protein [Lachnospiraceae bacterium]